MEELRHRQRLHFGQKKDAGCKQLSEPGKRRSAENHWTLSEEHGFLNTRAFTWSLRDTLLTVPVCVFSALLSNRLPFFWASDDSNTKTTGAERNNSNTANNRQCHACQTVTRKTAGKSATETGNHYGFFPLGRST